MAGRAWALQGSGGGRADDALEDARRMGIDLTEEDFAPAFALWHWHLPAWEAFVAVCSQWRTAATMEGITVVGLDYSAARDGLAMAGIDIAPATWADLRLIEEGAVAALNRP